MTARYLVGDVFDRMAELPDGSVDLVMTSPPFLALRSYLPDGHPNRGKEIGSEPTPAAFIDTLLALTAEWRRILAPHGSICVELGDTYSGSGGAGGDYNDGGLRDGQAKFDGSARRNRPTAGIPGVVSPGGVTGNGNGQARKGDGWPLAKSLCGIPDAYKLSLEYGWNVLDRDAADSAAGRWRVRNKVAWVRPNPPVGALGDKFRPATSYLTIACTAGDRWFDLDAVRTPLRRDNNNNMNRLRPNTGARRDDGKHFYSDSNPAGAPPLDWWEIPPGGYSGAHYAVYPPELCRRPIDAMCPRRVCTTCGTPSRRITTTEGYRDTKGKAVTPHVWQSGIEGGKAAHSAKKDGGVTAITTTTGWSTCGCPGTDGIRLDGFHTGTGWRPGHVLDPFGGSGTTAIVATGLCRTCTLIDIDERNAELASDRLGMFLDVDAQQTTEVAS